MSDQANCFVQHFVLLYFNIVGFINLLNWSCVAIFSCGDILKIKDDLAVIRPTMMAIVPRLITRFYGVI